MFVYEKDSNVDYMELVDDRVLEQARIFLNERNQAYIKKEIEKKSAPYSEHPIVGSYRFTNLKRELDAVSKNLNQMIQGLPIEEKLLNIIWYRCYRIARQIQYLDFFNGDKKTINKIIDDSDAQNKKSCGSYLISVPNRILKERCGDDYFSYMRMMTPKFEKFFLRDIPKCFREKIPYSEISKNSPEGIGRFFVYQVFLDLSYQEDFSMYENDFVLSGPGCDFGLRQLFPNYAKRVSSEKLLVWVWKNSERLYGVDDWNKFFKEPEGLVYYHDGFTLANVENFFCEFGKYWKIFNNEKCKKRNYIPKH